MGTATNGRFTETLTQATFVEALLPDLTDQKAIDRDLYLRGKVPSRAGADQLRKQIFRNMFIEERDLEIADVVFNYFEAVRQRWPEAWNQGGGGWMLNKTNGFKALMRLLRPVYLRLVSPGDVPDVEKFAKLFARSKLSDDDFTVDRFKPGTSGETALYATLKDELNV